MLLMYKLQLTSIVTCHICELPQDGVNSTSTLNLEIYFQARSPPTGFHKRRNRKGAISPNSTSLPIVSGLHLAVTATVPRGLSIHGDLSHYIMGLYAQSSVRYISVQLSEG